MHKNQSYSRGWFPRMTALRLHTNPLQSLDKKLIKIAQSFPHMTTKVTEHLTPKK